LEAGGVALDMDNLSISDSVSRSIVSGTTAGSLIDLGHTTQPTTGGYTQPAVAKLGGEEWKLVQGKSWKSQSLRSGSATPSMSGMASTTVSTTSGFHPAKYGHPSASLASNVTEPSDPSMHKSGFAKIKAYVCNPNSTSVLFY
jgi:hypothetical protein